MGWQSGLLGGNVVSSYLHVDNLRNDLVSGKFWNASDGSETEYLQISHDGTDGLIMPSSGSVRIDAGANGLSVASNNGADTVNIYYDMTGAYITTSSGPIQMTGAAGSGVRVLSSDGSKQLSFSHDGTNGVVNSNNGKLVLTGGGDNRRVQVGGDALWNMHFRLQDGFTGSWVRAYVYNGAWVIESDA